MLTAAFERSMQERVPLRSACRTIAEQSNLPKQVDSANDVDWCRGPGQRHPLRRHGASSSVDPASITESAIRDLAVLAFRSNSDTKELLDEDVDMRYTYAFDGSSKTLDTTFTKSDCS